MRRPLLVIVSGAPGAGKSTLARKIADYMRFPHIERDTVLRSIEFGSDKQLNRAKDIVPMYYDLLKVMLTRGMSIVTDGTIYQGVSESDIQAHLLPFAHVVNVHARAKNEHQRWLDRENARESRDSKDWINGHLPTLHKVYDSAVNPLDIGVKVIEVDCNDGYYPQISDLVAMIEDDYDQHERLGEE